jgi:formate dehydrogenase iron-sulfur subunit
MQRPVADVVAEAGYDDPPERVGFFTDTSVCIGCKACEVACKEWNALPGDVSGDSWASGAASLSAAPPDALALTGMSYDNTGQLGADSWRHVAFIEQQVPAGHGTALALADDVAESDGTRWLMASDVCKHCTHAACLDVCPTGALVRTEFGTVIVQPDICNGCAYCVSACPFGVIDRREDDGRAWKCTMCYDRLRGGLEPACAKACPTDSIQFGPLDELRAAAAARLDELHEAGEASARLYGEDPDDGIGGAAAFFLLLDEPEVYGLPPDPVVTTRDLAAMWRWAGGAAAMLAAGTVAVFARSRV